MLKNYYPCNDVCYFNICGMVLNYCAADILQYIVCILFTHKYQLGYKWIFIFCLTGFVPCWWSLFLGGGFYQNLVHKTFFRYILSHFEISRSNQKLEINCHCFRGIIPKSLGGYVAWDKVDQICLIVKKEAK